MKRNAEQPEMPSIEQLEKERARCRYRNRFRRTLLSTVAVLLVVSAITVLVTMLWLPVYRIYGSSMAPTLESGQIVIAVKTDRWQKGDLVAFYYGNKLLIKRVIAGPQDVVDIKENGDVYLNGKLLNEDYVNNKALGNSDMKYPLRVTQEHWFLLGDNRTVSIDSRDAQIGCVSQEQIVGKVVLRIWPLGLLQKLSNGTE